MTLLILPFPPSANHCWRLWNNRMVLSTEGRTYKLQTALRAKALHATKWKGRVAVELRFYRPRRIGDLDNRIKPVLDALNGVAWDDDEQVVELHAYRADDKENPRVEVVTRELIEGAT